MAWYEAQKLVGSFFYLIVDYTKLNAENYQIYTEISISPVYQGWDQNLFGENILLCVHVSFYCFPPSPYTAHWCDLILKCCCRED